MNITRLLAVVAAVANSSMALGAQTWTIAVPNATTATPECADQSKPDTCLFARSAGKTNAFDNGATITINCGDAAICASTTLQRENNGTPVSEVAGGAMATPTRKVYTLATGDFTSGRNVGVFFQRNLLTAFTLQSNTAASNPTTSTGAITLETAVAASNPMPLLDCPPTVTPDYSDTTGYGNSKAVARMYVDALGNVLARSSGYSFDENDSLELYVLGDPDLLQRVRVARTSEIRDVTVIRNIGEGVQAPSIERQARAGAPTCGMRRFDIGDFAPGKGVVTISRVRNDAVEPIGAFELNVAPLYSGIFSLGAISTEAVDPEFKLVTNGTDQVIAPGDASDDDLFYSIFYTPFLSGKRDTEKPFAGSKWYRHFNPAFGLVLDDVSDHFLFGLSIDLPRGFVLTAGQHYRKVTVLSEESGYAIGSVFPGAADTIPTAESWEHEKFVSVSFDIRVMAQLIRNAFTAAPN